MASSNIVSPKKSDQKFIIQANGRFISTPGSTNQVKYARQFSEHDANKKAEQLRGQGLFAVVLRMEEAEL